MTAQARGRFEGLRNVVAFNWPYYVAAAVGATLLLGGGALAEPAVRHVLWTGAAAAAFFMASALAVSAWVYDLSDLYRFPWLDRLDAAHLRRVVLVNAGFDEIGGALRDRLPQASMQAFDFFDPMTQTEASIRRARLVGARSIEATPARVDQLPIEDSTVGLAVAFMSAHEIRDDGERVALFRELRRCLEPSGAVVVVEHLRDCANLLAYNVGFVHFLPRARWLRTFREAGLYVAEEIAQTPFVTAFVLRPQKVSS